MNTLRFVCRVMACFLILLVWHNPVLQGTQSAHGQEVLRGLDISEVELDLVVPGHFHKTLQARALSKFADAGLKLQTETGFPRLKLTLMPLASRHCQDVHVYQRKLELQEEITLARSGHKRIVTTWFYGNESGFETKNVTMNDLQKDLDEMLKVFIEQYEFLNPKRRPPQ